MEELQKFASQAKGKKGGMFIVSNSRIGDIKMFADYHKIDLTLFTEILVNDFEGNSTKEKQYKYILDKYGYSPDEVLVIGNSYKNDILLAKELKLHTFLCKNGFTYEEVVD